MNNKDLRPMKYLHGELDSTERQAFEADLATSTTLQNELAELKAVDEQLNDFFQSMPNEQVLEEEQASKVEFKATPKGRGWVYYAVRIGSVAACIVFFLKMSPETEPHKYEGVVTCTIETEVNLGKASTKKSEAKKPVLHKPVSTESKDKLSLKMTFKEEDTFGFLGDMESEETALCESAVAVDNDASEARDLSIAKKSVSYRLSTDKNREVKPMGEPLGNLKFKGAKQKRTQAMSSVSWQWSTPLSKVAFQIDPPTQESYALINESGFKKVSNDPLSTFSVDVDTASYSNIRRMLNGGNLPPKDAVRVEEFLNYFRYDYPQPKAEEPFGVSLEDAVCPWNEAHRIVRIGINSKKLVSEKRPASNLVFLLDVSGSMNNANKLPLLKKSMRLLIDNLSEKDRVAIVVYAGASGMVLPSTSCSDKTTILAALNQLSAGGSTNGGAGIELAYRTAVANFIEKGTNRVILATDGDFNVGNTTHSGLVRMIEKYRETGVFLSVLGFGMGNLKDDTMEKLANKGNGNYAYIDSIKEAKKVLVNEMGATLVTVAKDVKIQVEFNPTQVSKYRLIGYENRKLNNEDFSNDKKDAGEIGAGHQVTALYEVELGQASSSLKYQTASESSNSELLTVNIRYKKPTEDTSQLLSYPLAPQRTREIRNGSPELRFATGVAAFAMILRDSEHKGSATFEMVNQLCQPAVGSDSYRNEFITLVKKAKRLQALK